MNRRKLLSWLIALPITLKSDFAKASIGDKVRNAYIQEWYAIDIEELKPLFKKFAQEGKDFSEAITEISIRLCNTITEHDRIQFHKWQASL